MTRPGVDEVKPKVWFKYGVVVVDYVGTLRPSKSYGWVVGGGGWWPIRF